MDSDLSISLLRVLLQVYYCTDCGLTECTLPELALRCVLSTMLQGRAPDALGQLLSINRPSDRHPSERHCTPAVRQAGCTSFL